MPRYQLFIFTIIRTVMATSHRMIYPFLAVFARGLDVDISVVSGVVASRSVVAAVTPVIFPFIETRGRKFGMSLGVVLFVLAMGIVALFPSIIPLNSEVMPSARATTLALAGSSNFIGRAIAATLAPMLYAFSFGIVTATAVVLNLLALVAVRYISKHHD